MRWRAAAATTKSARRSAARGPRPGFSMDLREIATHRAGGGTAQRDARALCCRRDAALQRRIATLRKAGEIVIVDCPATTKRATSSAAIAGSRCATASG